MSPSVGDVSSAQGTFIVVEPISSATSEVIVTHSPRVVGDSGSPNAVCSNSATAGEAQRCDTSWRADRLWASHLTQTDEDGALRPISQPIGRIYPRFEPGVSPDYRPISRYIPTIPVRARQTPAQQLENRWRHKRARYTRRSRFPLLAVTLFRCRRSPQKQSRSDSDRKSVV